MKCKECNSKDGWHIPGCPVESIIFEAWITKERQSYSSGVCVWCNEKLENYPTTKCKNPSIHTIFYTKSNKGL